ncbi:MAG: hypothetical protein A2Y59_02395 [Chloroflexi bacterium RBG_13_52_14]|nr:MAG: hypothetical protein A2Y59_02395 [Chloroflexi bacterium RBG_13_52_14]
MNEVTLAIILALFFAIICPLILNFFIRHGRSAYRSITFPELAVSAVDWKVIGGEAEVTLKLAHSGSTSLIIDRLCIKGRFRPASRATGILLWPRTIVGLITGDKYLSGRAFVDYPSSHKSGKGKPKNTVLSFLRRPIDVLFGLIYCPCFVACIVHPLLWPLLVIGPFGEFQMIASGEAISMKESPSRRVPATSFLLDTAFGKQLQIPFLLNPTSEEQWQVRYKLSLTGLSGFPRKTPFEHTAALPQPKNRKLPKMYEFAWKGKEMLLLQIKGKWRQYPLEIHTAHMVIPAVFRTK